MLFQLAIRARLPDSSEGYPLRPDRRDTRPSQRGPLSRPQPGFIDSPWIARMDIANGTLADGLSHDFDKARYLSGEEFVSVISKITPVTIKPDGDFFVDGGRSVQLAELSGGILAQFCFSITVGEDRFSWLIVGDEGSLRVPDSGTVVVRQRHDDDEPIELEIANADKA